MQEETDLATNQRLVVVGYTGPGYIIHVDSKGNITGFEKGVVKAHEEQYFYNGKDITLLITKIKQLANVVRVRERGQKSPEVSVGPTPPEWSSSPVALHGEEALGGLVEATIALDHLLSADHINIIGLDGNRIDKIEAYDALKFWHSLFYHYIPKEPGIWGGTKANVGARAQGEDKEIEHEVNARNHTIEGINKTFADKQFLSTAVNPVGGYDVRK